MKKWKIGVVCAILVMALAASTTVFAAGFGGHHRWYAGTANAAATAVCSWTGNCWQDTDGDGVRDTWNGYCADADGDGICDTCGQAVHSYVDTNGDGICDHYGSWYTSGGHHSGQGHCHW